MKTRFRFFPIVVGMICGCASSSPYPVAAPSSAPESVAELQLEECTEDPITCTQERDCACDFCCDHPYQDEDSL
jgi:hypothetical protein